VGNAEISVLFAARRVLQRQIDGGWYPGFLFPVAHILWAIPRALLECALFMCTIYFMLGLSASPGAFFTQSAIVLMAQLSTSAWLRLVAFSTPTIELANT
jgi:ABC-type multidrug transport system permease subunit